MSENIDAIATRIPRTMAGIVSELIPLLILDLAKSAPRASRAGDAHGVLSIGSTCCSCLPIV